MAVAMLLMLLGLITILGLVEVGYLYWAHRDAQKVADLAALSGAQQLSNAQPQATDCSTSPNARTSALGNAADNGYTSGVDVTCGQQPASGSSILAPASASSVAAVKVTVQRPVHAIWGFAGALPNVKTEAVAINSKPIAAFSVGGTLVGLGGDSALNQLLEALLGTTLDANVISSNGIANANVSLLGIKDALDLGAGTVDELLDTQISVDQFIDAYITALGQNGDTASATLQTLGNNIKANAKIDGLYFTLGDILKVNADTNDPNAALNTTVNALGILEAAVLAADSDNALAIPALTLNTGVANVKIRLSVIEPPQIGIGGVGTTAHSAQIRIYLDVSALQGLSNESLLDLPLYLEVASASATITNIECNTPKGSGNVQDIVDITGTPGSTTPPQSVESPAILHALLGITTNDVFDNKTNTWGDITSNSQPVDLINVNGNLLGGLLNGLKLSGLLNSLGLGWLLGTPPSLLKVTAYSNISLSMHSIAPPLEFIVDPSIHPISQQPNMTQTVGAKEEHLLSNAIASLLDPNSLKASVYLSGNKIDLASDLLKPLLSTLSAALVPVTGILDPLVDPLLQTLGIQLGTAQITLLSVNCNAGPQLVY